MVHFFRIFPRLVWGCMNAIFSTKPQVLSFLAHCCPILGQKRIIWVLLSLSLRVTRWEVCRPRAKSRISGPAAGSACKRRCGHIDAAIVTSPLRKAQSLPYHSTPSLLLIPIFELASRHFSNAAAFVVLATRSPSCRVVDYFSTVSGWLRLQFDEWTAIFNGFRMASTTVSSSGLLWVVDYDFKFCPRCARLV